MKNLIDINQACKMLNLKKPTIYKKVFYREIPFIQKGSKLLFSPEKLEKWVSEHSIDPICSTGKD